MQRSGAQLISDFLERRGVRVVAGMPGGANLPIYDALLHSQLQHVLVRHEQAAGFIAQGMARVSGRAGVCFATSGPGVTNLLTPLADAKLDSIPVVAITGQVPTALLGTDAFQEVDAVNIFQPAVKHAVLVRHVDQLWESLTQAFDIAESGRPGPVLVDVPKDVQLAAAEVDSQGSRPLGRVCTASPQRSAHAEPACLDAKSIRDALALLSSAQRPVLYLGGGVIHAGRRAHTLVHELALQQQLPVVCSLMGLGAFDPAHTLYCGMLGMHAAPYTNLVMRECDLIIALGARFDDRATGKLSEFCPGAKTLHVDIDPCELGKLRRVDVGIRSDAAEFLQTFVPLAGSMDRSSWLQRVQQLRAQHPLPEPQSHSRLHPLAIVRELASELDPDTVVTTDVGQHQMWVAQQFPVRRPRHLLTSGGLGTMGFGLPAAIGAALQTRGRVVCVSGDGSLLINIQELATLAELKLDVTIILFDNRQLGMVTQQQKLFYGERLSASRYEHALDFVAVARGFGIEACDWEPTLQGRAELRTLLARRGPRLIRVPLSTTDMVLPMVPPGGANHDMLGATLNNLGA